MSHDAERRRHGARATASTGARGAAPTGGVRDHATTRYPAVLSLYRLGARPLAVIAASSALILPQVLYVVQQALNPGGGDGGGPGGIWAWPADADGIVPLLFTGGYPALARIPFVVAGMAVARLDLASTVVRTRLAITGVSPAVLGYGGSFQALRLVPGVASALRAFGWGEGGSVMSAGWSDTACHPTGTTPAWPPAASPHSETTLSVVANTGVAIAVPAACLAATDTLPRFRRLAAPVIAVGTMSLTAYVFHIVAGRREPWLPTAAAAAVRAWAVRPSPLDPGSGRRLGPPP
ncbi:hypothetical protein ACFZDJ_24180 [Streptomyces sp. NPDC007896]|uniref:hypothetical protein n=1 Tax=Streptomyces sp. NPDC007896 TaxID=3364784 RepID=UPI0036E61D4A